MAVLHHYTNFRGLVGIAKTGTLRATDFRQLNDKTEFNYALNVLFEAALVQIPKKLPADLRKKLELRRGNIAHVFRDEMKKITATLMPHEAMYSFSFGRAVSDIEIASGIPYLWNNYTNQKGFCFVFDRSEVIKAIESEKNIYNYDVLELVDVNYGIDETESNFQELREILTDRLLQFLARNMKRFDIFPKNPIFCPDNVLSKKLLKYCGSHKDVSFAYEQETRILAFPSSVAKSEVLGFFKTRVPIYSMNSSDSVSHFISLFASFLPSLSAKQVLASSQCDSSEFNSIADIFASPLRVKTVLIS